ncbi:MAG: hypothetical protein EP305_11585 [Bacteroidetes bacterium]|nr:MAG: hypothetical protein EP305_11585 [Bacteroidota bacterium]
MKTFALLFIVLFSLSACNNSSIETPELEDETTEIIQDTTSGSALKEDTLVAVPVVSKEETTAKKKIEKPKVELVEKVEVDVVDDWIRDPMDDPDYIGTPCGDYDEFGNCTRHHHKYQNWENKYPDSIEIRKVF